MEQRVCEEVLDQVIELVQPKGGRVLAALEYLIQITIPCLDVVLKGLSKRRLVQVVALLSSAFERASQRAKNHDRQHDWHEEEGRNAEPGFDQTCEHDVDGNDLRQTFNEEQHKLRKVDVRNGG